MTKTKVALIVNTPLRDLDGMVLLSYQLAKRNAVAFLVPPGNSFFDPSAMAPNYVLLPVFRENQSEKARRLIYAGVQYGLLDTEGGIVEKFEYVDLFWREKILTDYASSVFNWGNFVQKIQIEEKLFRDDQINLTGHPRFDFYAPEWSKSIRKTISSETGSDKKDIILLNTALVVANPHHGNKQKLIDDYIKNGIGTAEVMQAKAKAEEAAMQVMIELAKKLAETYPHLKIILRPHPQERLESYIEPLSGISNIEVTNESPIHFWLSRAYAVVHRHCTTGIEANLTGIPAITPSWLPSGYNLPLIDEISVNVDSYKEVTNIIDACIEGTYQRPEAIIKKMDDMISDVFYKIDGKASERIADILLASIKPDNKPNMARIKKILYYIDRDNWKKQRNGIVNYIKYFLGLPTWFSFSHFKNDRRLKGGLNKYYTIQNVEKVLAMAKDYYGDKENYKVSWLMDTKYNIRKHISNVIVIEKTTDNIK